MSNVSNHPYSYQANHFYQSNLQWDKYSTLANIYVCGPPKKKGENTPIQLNHCLLMLIFHIFKLSLYIIPNL